MNNRLTDHQIALTFQRALKLKGKVVGSDDTSVIFYDLSAIERRFRDIIRLFPRNALHAVAIKANPLLNILKMIRKWGGGAEVASFPELHIALKAGFPRNKIVFDSPAKTIRELRSALELGVRINVDSFQELDRIDKILTTRRSDSTIGIRINPQVGTGKIRATSVAGLYSKFGIPLHEYRAELKASFLRHEWLRGVHLHIGSQGCTIEQLVSGVGRVFEFVQEVNHALRISGDRRQIRIFDIGGGLPVSYVRGGTAPSIVEYKQAIGCRCPSLMGGEFKLITEFGRYVYANAGWVASRVEYVKESKSTRTAIVHVGADLLLRESYNPEDWHHEVLVLDEGGRIKSGRSSAKNIIGGPLCFAGDKISYRGILPEINAGDYVIVQDVGAYTLSMWSRYNSRQVPKVIGYRRNGAEFGVLKEKESVDDVLRFWS